MTSMQNNVAVAEILKRFETLSEAEQVEVSNRIWDARIERDLKAGKLDATLERSRQLRAKGQLTDL